MQIASDTSKQKNKVNYLAKRNLKASISYKSKSYRWRVLEIITFYKEPC